MLLSREGTVKLADFGVSSYIDQGGSRKTLVGTPMWMAPEVAGGGGAVWYGVSADIWSLGVTAIELATGSPPYCDLGPVEAMHAVASSAPPRLPHGYPQWLRRFVAACLQVTWPPN